MKIVCLVFVFFAMESDYRGCSAMLYSSVITRLFHALTLLSTSVRIMHGIHFFTFVVVSM